MISFSQKRKLVFSCFSWQCHQSLLVHFLLASNVWCCVLSNHFCVANSVLYITSVSAGVCIFMYCHLFAIYGCAHWPIYSCVDSIHIYVHTSDFLVSGVSTVVPDSLSAMYESGTVFYKMCILYWCIHSIMHFNCWDDMSMSFLSIATNGSWSVMIHTSLAKQ